MARNIDKELQELALTRWDEFKKLCNIDPTRFIVCTERKKGKSFQQISISVKKSKTQVYRICAVCP